MASDGDGLSFFSASMCLSMREQEGTSHRGFRYSVPLGTSRTSVCILRSVNLAYNGIRHILVWGKPDFEHRFSLDYDACSAAVIQVDLVAVAD